MHVWVYLALVFPLAAAPLARVLTGRADPRYATWVMTGAAVLLAGVSCGALGLLTLAALARLPLLAGAAHLSGRVLARTDPVAPWVAAGTGVLFGAAALGAGRFALRRGRALVDAFRQARDLPGQGSVVITEDGGAQAYTVPGRPGRIIVSRELLGLLDEPGRIALLAHERAHLTGRHYLFTSAARLAAAANPLLRPLAAAVEFSVERWADERAAAAVGDRRVVAEAIAHAALAGKAAARSRQTGYGLRLAFAWRHQADRLARSGLLSKVSRGRLGAAVGGTGPGPGPVPRRVTALLSPRRRGFVVLVGAGALLTAIALTALDAATDLQALLAAAHLR